MMNAAIVDAQGVVQNVLVLDRLSDVHGAVLCPDHVGIGMRIDAPKPQAAKIADPVVASTTPLAFIERFTDAEQLAIVTAAMTVPQIRLWYDKLIASTQVIFADPRLNAGLDAMVAAGLITHERRAAILPNGTSGMQAL